MCAARVWGKVGMRGGAINTPRKYTDREGVGGSVLYFPRLQDSQVFLEGVGSTSIGARIFKNFPCF